MNFLHIFLLFFGIGYVAAYSIYLLLRKRVHEKYYPPLGLRIISYIGVGVILSSVSEDITFTGNALLDILIPIVLGWGMTSALDMVMELTGIGPRIRNIKGYDE